MILSNLKALGLLICLLACQWVLPAQTAPKSENKILLDSLLALHPSLALPTLPEAPVEGRFAFDSIPNFDSLSNDQVFQYAFELAQRAVSVEQIFMQNAQRASYLRQVREYEVEVSKGDTTFSKSEQSALKSSLKALKSLEKKTQKHLAQAKATSDYVLKINQMDTASIRKNLPKLRSKVAALVELNGENAEVLTSLEANAQQGHERTRPPAEERPRETVQVPIFEAPEAGKNVSDDPEVKADEGKDTETAKPEPAKTSPEKTLSASAKKYKPYNPKEDVMLHPPLPRCEFTFDGRDEFSGDQRRETKREEFFRFTNDFMKPHLKETPHILCEANLTLNGSVMLLNLVFTIHDSGAKRTFGGLAKGSVATLKLIDGITFNLTNIRGDEGLMDESGRVATFRAQYVVDRPILKRLALVEVDKIRVAWSKGYEDYEIYNIDLIKRHLRCMNQSN